MSLFSFGKKKGYALALIDIGSASVGGAYAYYEPGQAPIIYYTARVDIEPKKDESITDSMLRSLAFLERLLVEEGAAQLRRETGSGSVRKILVSLAAPWQETKVTSTHIEKQQPFAFTHAHLKAAGENAIEASEGRISTGYRVISTNLNGYETARPFGKYASRVDLVFLSSTLEKDAANRIKASLRHAFHAHDLEFLAFAPVASEVFASLYPHQDDFVVIDVSGAGTDVAFVKQGHLSQACAIPCGTHDLLQAATEAGQRAHALDENIVNTSAGFAKDTAEIEASWLESLKSSCAKVAAEEVLPRTVFLLSDPAYLPYLTRILEKSPLRSLWLTDEPLQLIPVQPSHLASRVKTRGLGDGDVFLMLLALYGAQHGL